MDERDMKIAQLRNEIEELKRRNVDLTGQVNHAMELMTQARKDAVEATQALEELREKHDGLIRDVQELMERMARA